MTTTPTPAPDAAEIEARGIYIASKTVHGPRWEKLRAEGAPIVSTWIDEYYPGATSDWVDLWTRCVSEAASASALILYREPGEVLKGAWLEAGAALAHGVPVFAVGCEDFTARHHPGINLCADFDTAYAFALAALRSLSRPVDVTDAMVERGAVEKVKWTRPMGSPVTDGDRRIAELIIRAALGGRDNG